MHCRTEADSESCILEKLISICFYTLVLRFTAVTQHQQLLIPLSTVECSFLMQSDYLFAKILSSMQFYRGCQRQEVTIVTVNSFFHFFSI
jgi:hypothetical protein